MLKLVASGFRVPTLTLLAACSGSAAPPDRHVQLPSLLLKEEWRIEGNSAAIGPVTWIAVSRDDAVYVSQPLDRRILRFDSAGRFEGSFGGYGRDPGSFLNLGHAGSVGDTLWVFDPALYRVTLIAPDLRLIGSYRWPPEDERVRRSYEASGAVPTFVGLAETGATITSSLRPRRLAGHGTAGPVGPLGGRLVTAHPVEPPRRFAGGALIFRPHLFDMDPLFAISPDGSALALLSVPLEGPALGTFEITRFNARGDPTFTRRHPFYPEPIPRAVIEETIEEAERLLAARGGGTAAERRAIRNVTPPPFYPPVEEVLPGRDGSTWIRMRALVEDNSEYYVLDGAGELIGQATLPASVRIAAGELTGAWGIHRDSLGIESVVRYSVSLPTGSAAGGQ